MLNPLSWLKRRFLGGAKPARSARGFRPRSKFDSAGTTSETRTHWSQADSCSPNAAVSADVRRTIRERARYEVANNCVLAGMVTARVSDLIGSGPRPQISLPEPDTATLRGVTSADRVAEREAARHERERLVRVVEDEFAKWCRATRFAATLRTLVRAEIVDGESFALVTSNPKVRHAVKLQLRPFECDRATDPSWLPTERTSDGIEFDEYGNPVSYTVLRQHPGDQLVVDADYDTVPADGIFHFFRADRPGQTRGVSWLTPGLRLSGDLRRYSLAVLGNAETAANLAVLVEQSESGVVPGEDDESPDEGPLAPFVEFEVPRRSGMALPPGARAVQLQSPHTTTAYGDYRREVLNEMGRCLDMPLNLVIGNSSQFNFSSSRIDHLPYQRKLWIEREEFGESHLNRLFELWLDEAVVVGLIPDGLPPLSEWVVDWNWDGFDSSGDPTKDTAAIQQLLDLNLTTLAEQCAARGLRWQDVLRQRKREQEFAASIGLKSAAPAPVAAPVPDTPRPADGGEDTAVPEEEAADA